MTLVISVSRFSSIRALCSIPGESFQSWYFHRYDLEWGNFQHFPGNSSESVGAEYKPRNQFPENPGGVIQATQNGATIMKKATHGDHEISFSQN